MTDALRRGHLLLLQLSVVLLGVLLSACGAPSTTSQSTPTTNPATTSVPSTPLAPGDLRLEPFAIGLNSPVYLTAAPGQSDRVYVVEQTGRIRIVGMDGAVRAQPFLDIHSLLSSGSERGLLSVVFHPDYAHNGLFFVDYTATNGAVTVARYQVSPTDPYRADPKSAVIVLSVPHPVSNHNGGLLLFGRDGYLYVGIGDGGSGNSGNGQRMNVLLGKILRIDVNHTAGGQQYAIPADNPFVAQAGARPEIWAYGLRNPWRFSFDRATGDLFIGDVGQNAIEELNFQPAASKGGQNYGWAIYEGDRCYAGGAACSTGGLTKPITVYTHGDGSCVVTAGYVYRGQRSPKLNGVYIYGDYCSGKIWTFPAMDAQDGQATAQQALDTDLQIASFGEDTSGELYVVSLAGSIYRVTA
jgi:glucose/arabinose dehydrogenase